ncbi:MAG TPA: hypothetical protein VII01_08460, partial [Solirubrobacteraceae bacterium]
AQSLQVRASGRTDAGTSEAKSLVHTIRATYIPAAGFPRSDLVLLTGAPAFGVDLVAKAYGAFPWLVLAVLAITYLVLLRAFRSVVLPLKAVLLNLLSVSAAIDVVAEPMLCVATALSPGAGVGTRQSSGRAAKSRLAFLYHPIPERGCFHLPFISFNAPSCVASPFATASFRCMSCAFMTSSAVVP